MAKVKHTRPIQIPLVTGLAAGGIMLWAWLGSGEQPEGCYRIDKDTHLAMADGKVRIVGKHSGAARIVASDRVRGWVVKLDRTLSYDPARPSETRFVQAGSPSRADSLFIDQRFGEARGILFHPEHSADVRFPEVTCDTLPPG